MSKFVITEDQFDAAHDAYQDVYDGDNHRAALRHALEAAILAKNSGKVVEALAGMLDSFGGYVTPEVTAAIHAMQGVGIDRWSMNVLESGTFTEDELGYDNIFDAITEDASEAAALSRDADFKIALRRLEVKE